MHITTGLNSPSFHLSQNKNRLKHTSLDVGATQDSITAVYMENDTNFEIEFTNPSTTAYKLIIYINDHSLYSGRILHPASHIYLERFLDKQKKFRFEIDDAKENEIPLDKNVKIRVEFFKDISNQDLAGDTYMFETTPSVIGEIQILPQSRKNEYIDEFRNYCTECGRRSKKGWKFCPGCGEKYQ